MGLPKRNARRKGISKEAPEFARLKPALKRLVRRIGEVEDQRIESESGAPGKGWSALDDEGWINIRERDGSSYGGNREGYVVTFNLYGWECWCRQCDAEEGRPLTEFFFQ